MTVEVRQVARFDKVRFRGPGIVKISQGDRESLTIHAPGYVMNNIQSRVDRGTLLLGYVSPRVVSLKVHREVISYALTVKDLRRVALVGAGRIRIPDLDNDVVSMRIDGSGQIAVEQLTADRLEVVINGAGRLKVSGDVETQSVAINGAGHYEADALVSDFGQISVTGAGVANMIVNDDLNVAIKGPGKVTYSGYPEVFKQISGSGVLTRMRRNKKEKSRQGEGYE